MTTINDFAKKLRKKREKRFLALEKRLRNMVGASKQQIENVAKEAYKVLRKSKTRSQKIKGGW